MKNDNMKEFADMLMEDFAKYGKIEGNNIVMDSGLQRQKIGNVHEKVINTNTKFEDLQSEVFMHLLSKEKAKATEIIVKEIKDTNHIYTTKDDSKSEMWIYNKGIYIPQGKSFVKEYSRKILGVAYTINLANEVIAKIEADTFIEQDEFFNHNYLDEVPVENGILNIFTRELKDFTPEKIFFNKLPVEYNELCECIQINKFLKEVLAKEEDIEVFYELCGYCLLKEYRYEKAFMLVGDGRNGKDKSLELIKRLIGIENCCSVPLSSLLPDSFIISQFFGKMVNVAGDINNHDLKDTSTFKALTGRSLVSAPRKFLNPVTFVNHSKFIFACNDLPMVYDTSRGFWDRWVLLEFPYTFVNKDELEEGNDLLKLRDENIIDKITTHAELSGFLNRCLDALGKLIENKDFSNTLGSQEIKEMWIRKSNSVMAFSMESVKEEYDDYITKKQFRKRYIEFCKKYKLKAKSDYVIKRTLEEEYGVVPENKAIIENRYENVWSGITWKI